MAASAIAVLHLPPPSSEYILDANVPGPGDEPMRERGLAPELLAQSMDLGRIAAESSERPVAADDVQPPSQRFAAELTQLRAEAQREGFEAGMKAGQEQWQQRGELLYSIAAGIERAQREMGNLAAEDAVAIAFEAVTRILGTRTVARQAIAQIVEQVRTESAGAGPLIVRVGSDDYEALLAEPALIELEDQRGVIRLVEDPRVLLGGCIVESSRGVLDARLETQMQRLKSVLMDVHKAEAQARGSPS